jgi:hypothetical protein
MNSAASRRATLITWLLVLLPPLLFLAPALRPGFMLLPAQLPYLLDPLWQPLAPEGALAQANPVLSDQFYQYHAWKFTLWQALAQGELPLWTPAVNGGQPLLANGQVGLFDPFNLAERLFPLTSSYVVGALLRLWVAGGFTYLYARTIGLSHPAAWLALLVFTLSGPLVSWLGATPSHVLVWLPALLWVGERLLTTRQWGWVWAASGLVALLLFSSQPEIALQMGIVWGIYLLCRAIWLEGGILLGLRRHGARWLLIALLGLALAAVEVLPFVDALRHSMILAQRFVGTQFDLALWLQHVFFNWQEWPTLVTILLPNFLGREASESYWYPTGNSIENNAYAGVLPLLLALLALWAAWRNVNGAARRWIWLWGGLGAGCLALAVGLPLFNALNDLPPFSLVAPGRLRGIYGLAVALLAGWGLDGLRQQPTLRRPLTFLLAGAAIVNVLLVIAAYTGFTLFAGPLIASGRAYMEANVGSPGLDRPLNELYALVETRQQAKLAMLRPANPVMYLPLLVGCGVLLLLWLQRSRRLVLPWLTAVLIAITWLDLAWTGAAINTTAPASWLEPIPPAVEYLQSQPGIFRVVATHQILNPNVSMLTHLEDVRGYDPLAVQRYTVLLAGLDGYAPAHYHNYFVHLDDPRLDLFNATYGLSRTPPMNARWQPVFDDPSGVTVYRNRTALPRAYLVYTAEVVENAEQSLARTLAPSFDPRQSVVLEESPAGWTPPASAPSGPSWVAFTVRRANTMQLEVTTDAPGLLVLLDSYMPGWHATLDNQPTSIYPANHAFRAVVVPAGTHRVTLAYAPPALTWGASISAGALLVLLIGAIWARWMPERRQEHAP